MKKCRKRGFTLIELLVVIAIIALLLSIVMPALKEAKKQAQTVICRSNIKQWGIIFSLYAQDNEQSFPQSIASPAPNYVSDRDAYWMGATLPYYGDGKIRICPSTKPDIYRGGWGNYGSTFEQWGPLSLTSSPTTWWDDFPEGSYGINEWIANPPADRTMYWNVCPTANCIRKITAKNGSTIPIFMDCTFLDGATLHTDVPPSDMEHQNDTYSATWSTNAMKLFCIPRHKGGINGVFADMSARRVGMKELWKLRWHANYNTDNTYTRPGAPWPDWMRQFHD